MAYDANFYDAFSGRPAYQIHLYVRRGQTDIPNNRSTWAWALYAEKVSSGTTWTAGAYPYALAVAGYTYSGNSAALDFRSSNQNIIANGETGWVTHDGNGYLNFGVSAWYHTDGNEYFGNADLSGSMSADRIPKAPPAPSSVSITNVTSTSLTYSFSNNGDGGAGIDLYAAQYATNAAFTTGVWEVNGQNGLVTISNLVPGTPYWVRSRAHNSVGWGAWGNALTATTVSGAFVGATGSSTFTAVAAYVGKADAFVLAQVYVGKGGVYVLAS